MKLFELIIVILWILGALGIIIIGFYLIWCDYNMFTQKLLMTCILDVIICTIICKVLFKEGGDYYDTL